MLGLCYYYYESIDNFICSVLGSGDLFYSVKFRSATLGHICLHSIKHSKAFSPLSIIPATQPGI